MAGMILLLGLQRMQAAQYEVRWLDMSLINVGVTVPGGTVFNMPGYGNVRVDYNGTLTRYRVQYGAEQNGSIVNAANTYS